MEKFLTDLHTHTTFSHDGKNTPAQMLGAAYEKGIAFYGVSEHFDYDYCPMESKRVPNGDENEYFHTLRHLQEDYAGCMNVLVGAEFGYSEDEKVHTRYALTYEKYRPDFVINSVHSGYGIDYARAELPPDKERVYKGYLRLVRKSLDVPYPYDIVGHISYIMRYVPIPLEQRAMTLKEFGAEIDDILLTVIRKGKILEANTATKMLPEISLPGEEILRRYYELGGRKISFGSDAHFIQRIADKREELVKVLKEIGFTYLTVPCRGEYIKVSL